MAKCWNYSLSALATTLAAIKIHDLLDFALKPLENYIGDRRIIDNSSKKKCNC
jgi:hypothetical protein